jgi:hypothetical protein
MNLSNRKPLYLALALTLAAPLAFAQSTTPQTATPTTQDATSAATAATQDATSAATQEATNAATQDATAQTQSATQDAMAKGEPQKKNWSDLDLDKNGSLSATEAASVQNLSSVFAKADANADGELTQDEYKAYLAANGKGEAKSDSGG